MKIRHLPCISLVVAVIASIFSISVVHADSSETGATDPNFTYQSSLSLGKHSCLVVSDGSVKCWGANYSGQLGNGTTTDSSTPTSVSGLSSVSTIASSIVHSCALLTNGTVRCWGSNDNGRLGDGTTTDRSTPVSVVGLTGVTAISAGQYNSCAILTDTTVKCWGGNNNGGLGDGTSVNKSTPVQVTGLSGAVAITTGDLHSCALLSSGKAKCWGRNMEGQLGDATTVFGINRTPVDVVTSSTDTSPLSGIAAISAGSTHTCAVMLDRTAKCWGFNYHGQLGSGTKSPSNVSVPTNVRTSSSNSAPLTGVTAIAAGGSAAGQHHTCALLSSGAVKCWGSNNFGQLGNGKTGDEYSLTGSIASPVDVRTSMSASTPLTGVKAITAGDSYTCALLPQYEVKCWGRNDRGQLGDGSLVDKTSPVATDLDLSSPTFISAALSVNGTSIVLSFSEALSTTTADTSAFEVLAEGEEITVNSVNVSGSTITLSVAKAIGSSSSITVKYIAPTASTSTNNSAIQDSGGNDVLAIPTTPVTNNSTSDSIRPTASWTSPLSPSSSRSVTYTLTFSEPVSRIAGGDFSNLGTATGCIFSPSATSTSSSVTIVVTCTSDGTVIALLSANSVLDQAFNTGPSIATSSSSITIDTTPTSTAARTTPSQVSAPTPSSTSNIIQSEDSNTTVSSPQSGLPKRQSAAAQSTPATSPSMVSTSTSTTTLPPDTVPKLSEVEIPDVSNGIAGLLVGGKVVTSQVTRENNEVVVSSGVILARMWAVTSTGEKAPLDAQGRLKLIQGDSISISISGFDPNSSVEVRLYSDPFLLGRSIVDKRGALTASFEIPSEAPDGEHKVVLVGNTQLDSATLALAVVVGNNDGGPGLLTWLVGIPLAVAALIALLLPVAVRRRRKSEPDLV